MESVDRRANPMPPALLISVETCQVPNWIRMVANVVKCGRGLLSQIGHDGHFDWVLRLRRPFVLPLWMCGRSVLKCLLPCWGPAGPAFREH